MKKLVRDRIPELVGREAEQITGPKLRLFLKHKIIEELLEYGENPSNEEAADTIIAFLALCNFDGLCWEEVEAEEDL